MNADLICVHPRKSAAKYCLPGLASKHAHIDTSWVTEHHEPNILHVLLRHALDVSGCDRRQPFEKINRIAPAAANQLVLGQLTSLRRIRLLSEIIRSQILRHDSVNVVCTHGLGL